MNFQFTNWIHPIPEPIPLLDKPCLTLDNPRGEEINEVASFLEESYHKQLQGFFPPETEEGEEYISLDWMLSEFQKRFGSEDKYAEEILSNRESESVFETFAKIWIIARFDDEGAQEEIQEAYENMRKDGDIGLIMLEDENPIIKNSTILKNYLSLLSLLIHSENDEYFGRPILISDEHPLHGLVFDEPHFRHGIIMFMVFATSSHEQTQTDNSAWLVFPYVEKRLLEVRDSIKNAFAQGHEELLMYLGNILRVVQHDASDIRVRILMLISLIELMLTHNPNTNRFNVEDSISRQFRLKTSILVHRQYPDIQLDELEKRLKKLYEIRSAIAHGNFKAVAKYEANLCKKEGKEEYMDGLVTDSYFYLRAIIDQFLQDPTFVQFIKKS